VETIVGNNSQNGNIAVKQTGQSQILFRT